MIEIVFNKPIIVFYHGECPDGFSAAWAAWKKLGDSAQYVALTYRMKPFEDLQGKEIYFLDFSYEADVFKKLVANNTSVTVIDHHASRVEDIKHASKFVFDNDHSGAVLAWNYFHPNQKPPMFLKYIEDRDLWNWKLDNSHELTASIDSFDMSFDVWDGLVMDFENVSTLQKHVMVGEAILTYEKKTAERLANESKILVEFEGYTCYSINAPHIFASLISSVLIKDKPPIAIIWSYTEDGIRVSLRCEKENGSIDVSVLAAKYGGGGHKSAAGFTMGKDFKFPWKEI